MFFTASSHLQHLRPKGSHRKQELEHHSQLLPAFNVLTPKALRQKTAFMYFASALPHLPFPDLRNSKFNIICDFEFESPLDLYYNIRRK